MADPQLDLKLSITVQGKQSIWDLLTLVGNTRKSGRLIIGINEGNAVDARFEENLRVGKGQLKKDLTSSFG